MWTLSSALSWEINAENRSEDDCYYRYYYYHIVVFVVIVDDDTYYWVYLSPPNIYFKFITKYDGLLLQSVTAFLLQSEVLLQSEIVITNCDRYYKERRILQCETEQTKGFSCMFKKNPLNSRWLNFSIPVQTWVRAPRIQLQWNLPVHSPIWASCNKRRKVWKKANSF